MKYTSIILTSLLLLGVCSGRTLDFSQSKSQEDNVKEADKAPKTDNPMKPTASDYKHIHNYNEKKDKQTERFNLPSLGDIKDTIIHKLIELYQTITGQKSYKNYIFEDIPHFVDPLDVGSISDELSFATMEYQNVKFYGLRNVYQAFLKIDLISKKAELSVSMPMVEIKGQYVASDLVRKTSGDVHIKLFGSVKFIQTYNYEMKNSQVQVHRGNGELKYNNTDIHYENIGFFAKIIKEVLSTVFLQSINGKLEEEVSSKLLDQVNQYIQNSVEGKPKDKSEKVFREGIYNLANRIQQEMNKAGATSIDLNSNDREVVYKQLHAKISSVKLHGLDKFFLANNSVSVKDDQVIGKIQLVIKNPTATAIVSIHHVQNENAPFHKLNVDFNMDQVSTELSWDKQAGLKLHNIQTSVNNVEAALAEQYEGDVQTLVQSKLSSQVKHYIEDGLKNLFQNEIAAVIAQGVFPSSNLESDAYNDDSENFLIILK